MRSSQPFIGRVFEQQKIQSIKNAGQASILIVYGRRRVGKTELLERLFGGKNMFKFEGIEGRSQEGQIEAFLYQLARYVGDPKIAKLCLNRWMEAFDLLIPYIKTGCRALYFEEVQWLANYSEEFVSDLKYSWDNHLRHNPNLTLILCGSSPSFMINKILHSKSLYNRSQHEMHLQEFSIDETREFLGKHKSIYEVMDAFLIVGGIPEYLRYLKSKSSVFMSLCEHTFMKGSFFSKEFERILISSFAKNTHYKKIIAFLAKRRFATRHEIAGALGIPQGGGLSDLLKDLELCGFVRHEVPFNLKEGSMLSRYAIDDAYLQFYYKFVDPIKKEIDDGNFNQHPEKAINQESLKKWMGFAFERFCRKNHQRIADLLGFKNVRYRYGSFFDRRTNLEDPGYQMDLVFDRDDKVVTLCEAKYYQSKVGLEVIEALDQKIRKLHSDILKKTIQKVLIAPYGALESVMARHYFDAILTLEDFF